MPTERPNATDRLAQPITVLQEKHPIFSGLSFENEEHYEMIPGLLGFLESREAYMLEPNLSHIHELLEKDTTRTAKEKADIRRAVVLGTMFHQLNEQDAPESRFRKEEGENGLKAPYSTHTSRIVAMNLEWNLSTDMTIAAALHDVVEDCTITLGGKELKGKELLTHLQDEFKDYKNVGPLLDMLSYSGDLQDVERKLVEKSPLFRLAKLKYQTALLMENKKEEALSPKGKASIKKRVMKAVYGLAHIFQLARAYADEDLKVDVNERDARYFELLFKGLMLKSMDSYDNMGSKGLEAPISLRNRILVHAARLMGWKFDRGMMDRLIMQDPQDPFNPAATLRHVTEELADPATHEKARKIKDLLDQNGFEAVVTPRYQVSIKDEVSKIPLLQYLIEVKGDIAKAKKVLMENMYDVFGTYDTGNTLEMKAIAGRLHTVMKTHGRDTQQYRITETTDVGTEDELNVEIAYLRFDNVLERPDISTARPWEFARQNQSVTNFPEARIFFLPTLPKDADQTQGLQDAIQVVSALYNPTKADFDRMMAA